MKAIGGNINHQSGQNKNATISWDFNIHTDRTIQGNRPYLVVKSHNDKTCFLVDTSLISLGTRGQQNVASQNNNIVSSYWCIGYGSKDCP